MITVQEVYSHIAKIANIRTVLVGSPECLPNIVKEARSKARIEGRCYEDVGCWTDPQLELSLPHKLSPAEAK